MLRRALASVATVFTILALLGAPAHAAEPATISGSVSSPRGGVTDACVTAFLADTRVEVATDCVDESGQFAVLVEPGAYKLRIQATGFPEQWYFEHSTWERASRLDISEFGRSVFITLRDGFGDITGQITTNEDAPIANATVLSNNVPSGGQQSATTDADGRYTITDLPAPAQYRIFTMTPQHGWQYAFGAKAVENATVFDLAAGQVLVVNDRMLKLSTVEVVVVDERDGRRLTRGCVRLNSSEGGQSAESCTNVKGVFRFRDMPTRDYEVTAQPEGTHWPATTTLHVQPGQTHRVSITVERATAFVTRVREARTGRPAPGVCVQLASQGMHPALFLRGCSTDDGRLVIGPFEGAVTTQLYLVHPEDRYGAQWVGAVGGTGDQRQAKVFTAQNDTATEIQTFKVDPPGSITGVITDPTGAPAGNVCGFPFAITSTIALDRQVGTHCSDANGRYTITGLGPYAWPVEHIAVFRPQFAWIWSGGASDRFSARYVQVRSGQATTADLTLVPSGSISGRALTATGAGVFANSIVARNTTTGDLAAPPTTSRDFFTGAYEMRWLATQSVKIEYLITGRCWYDRVLTEAEATAVSVQAGSPTAGIDLVNCQA